MDTKSFYGKRPNRYGRLTRYILTGGVPDDGNKSSDDVDSSHDGDEVSSVAGTESESDETDSESADGGQVHNSLSDSESDDTSRGSVRAGSDNDKWSETSTATGLPKPFTRDSGPFIILSPDAKPTDYFQLLFPESLFTLMCNETNRYAASRNKVADTCVPELKAFLGLIIAMGIHRLPQQRDYWDGHWVLNVPQFTQVFTRSRFMHLWSNLHLVDNAQQLPRTDPSHDRLFKVRPVIRILQDTFLEHYYPRQNVSVDESMVRFKGRSSMKQYLPLKPIKRGFKVWSASCACCGYLLNFQIYTGSEGSQERGLAHRVVTDLCLPMLAHRQHTVYVDNFFTSMPLLTELESNGISLCGTYRTNRIGFPKELTDKETLKKMKRGDVVARYKGNTSCVVWMDKRPVYLVSNAFMPDTTSVKRKNADGFTSLISCPVGVANYNRYMGGVDLTDQLKGSYGYNRKSKRWWFRLFFHMVDLAVINSFILYRHCYQIHCHPPLKFMPMSQLQFRCQLADGLVNHFSSRKQRGRAVASPVVSLTPSGHKIQDLRQLGVVKGRCEYCSLGEHKRRKRKETVYGCPKCVKRLCPANCWTEFHSKLLPGH